MPCRYRRQHDGQLHGRAHVLVDERGAIGPQAEIGRMAEGDDAAGAHEEVEGEREEGEDEDLDHQLQREGIDEQRQHGKYSEPGSRRPAQRRRPALERALTAEGMAVGDIGTPHQPPRAHDQHGGHHQEDQHQGDLGKHQDAEGLELADEDGGEEGPRHRTHAADHRDHEGLGDDRDVHERVRGFLGDLQSAGETGEEGTEKEHTGEQQRLIDPEGAHHGPVLGGGAHEDAEARSLEQQPQEPEDGGPGEDEHDLVLGKAVAEDLDRAGQAGRTRPEDVLRPPDHGHQILDDEDDAEGGEQLEQLRCLVDAPEQQELHGHAHQTHRHRGGEDRNPERHRSVPGGKGRLDQGDRHIGTHHVERAVGEIHDAGDAEDDGQAAGGNEQRRGCRQAVQELDEQESRIHEPRTPLAPGRRSERAPSRRRAPSYREMTIAPTSGGPS
jgi:hypothetical protein